MNEQSYLAAKYAELETDALLEMYRSGLTTVAQEVARLELTSRGVEAPVLDEPIAPNGTDEVPGDWVVVAKCPTPTEAHILRSCSKQLEYRCLFWMRTSSRRTRY